MTPDEVKSLPNVLDDSNVCFIYFMTSVPENSLEVFPDKENGSYGQRENIIPPDAAVSKWFYTTAF